MPSALGRNSISFVPEKTRRIGDSPALMKKSSRNWCVLTVGLKIVLMMYGVLLTP